MPRILSKATLDRRIARLKAKGARKKAAGRKPDEQPALPPSWLTALARVKQHIRSESRNCGRPH